METTEKFAEFKLELQLYTDLFINKGYILPGPPLAMIKANAPLEQKGRFKKLLKNVAGIYGWLDVQQSLCKAVPFKNTWLCSAITKEEFIQAKKAL